LLLQELLLLDAQLSQERGGHRLKLRHEGWGLPWARALREVDGMIKHILGVLRVHVVLSLFAVDERRLRVCPARRLLKAVDFACGYFSAMDRGERFPLAKAIRVVLLCNCKDGLKVKRRVFRLIRILNKFETLRKDRLVHFLSCFPLRLNGLLGGQFAGARTARNLGALQVLRLRD
jgi:hypothetical protein